MVASNAYVENVISLLAQGTEANRATPGRQGNVICLTPELADEILITGDVHGHRRNFNRIRNLAALDEHPRRHLLIQEVCHGGPTYPENGGDMSHAILEDVARLKVKYPERVHFILGNHELAELADYPIQKNKQMLNLLFRLGMRQMYGDAADRVREAYFPFLRSCPLAVRLSSGVFVSHSIPEKADSRAFDASIFTRELGDDDYLTRSAVFEMVWGRDYRLENVRAFAEMVDARIVINGHEPCADGHRAPNEMQIILDCCQENPSCLILPVDEELSHAEILQRVQRLQ